MKRCAFAIRIRPGLEDEYRRRHAVVWPEVIEALERCQIRNYSIFSCGDSMFAYFETPGDGEETFRRLQMEPAMKKWRDHMSDIILRDERMGFRFLPEVFHMD